MEEKKQHSFKRRTVAKLIALGALAVVFAVLLILKNNQDVCEFFATTFSRAWIFVAGNLFGWLPFSVYELFLVCAIVGAVVFLVFEILHLCKRRWKSFVSLTLAVAISVMAFLNVYTATASFSYNRKPLPQEIYAEFNSDDFTYQEAVALASYLVDRLNWAYESVDRDEEGNIKYASFSEISDKLVKEYQKLDCDYLSPYTPRGKRIVNKWVMSQLHLTGVFFAPFGEANVNGNEDGMYMPTTLAHEMAHGKGVMTEYQADLVAYYVTVTSDDPYLAYGALAKLTINALTMVRRYPTILDLGQEPKKMYTELYNKINPGVLAEKQREAEFWSQFTLLKDIGKFFNDLYLKSQNQQNGTESYVKPGQSVNTGNKDDLGHEVVKVVRFSGVENLLINLYKQNMLGE